MNSLSRSESAVENPPRFLKWLVGASICVHFVLVIKLFGVTGLTSRDPIEHGDWAIKFTEAYIVGQTGQLPTRTWVYSTDHLAGYPAGVYTGVGTQAFDLWLLATRQFLPPPVAMRIFMFLLFLLPPFLPMIAARWTGLTSLGQTLSLLLSLAVWHLESHIQYMWTYGTTAFLTGSAIALCTAVLYGRMLSSGSESFGRSFARAAAVGLLAGIATTFHPLCGFVLASMCLWPFLGGLIRLCGRFLLLHLPAAAVFFIINAHWLIPFFQLRPDGYTGGAPGPFATGIRYFIADAIADRSYLRHFDTTVVLQLVGILTLIGVCTWQSPAIDRRQWCLGLVGLLSITYLGSYSKFFAELQPYRFLAAVIIFSLVPAAAGLETVLSHNNKTFVKKSLLLIVLIALVLPRFVHPTIQALSHPKLVGPDEDAKKLYSWLSANTDRQSRIMFERQAIHLANLAPWYLQRETIGGPYDHVPLAHRHSIPGRKVATDPTEVWFGKELDNLTSEDVKERLELLNVEWVIIRKGTLGEQRAERWSQTLERVIQVGSYIVYRNRSCRRSFFVQGSGFVESEPNVLRLTALSQGTITLKYHFLSTLRTEPELPLAKVSFLGDPIGYITFENPGHSEIVIRNSYR